MAGAEANKPVCGSDGVTYPSQCQVVSRQCQGESLLIKHPGPCPGNGSFFRSLNSLVFPVIFIKYKNYSHYYYY